MTPSSTSKKVSPVRIPADYPAAVVPNMPIPKKKSKVRREKEKHSWTKNWDKDD
jgi:hypothetical protein